MAASCTAEQMKADGDWQHAWHQAELRDYGSESPLLAQIVEVIHSIEGENDGPDWLCVARLGDGRFATMRAGCDYTGWD